MSPDSVWFFILLAIAVAPISEELFFRGFLQNAFRARMPWLLATFLQCLIFGIGHSFFYGVPYSIVTFFLGLLLTLLYRWRKTLVLPIFVHAGLNMIAAVGILILMAANADTAVLGVAGNEHDSVCIVQNIAPNSAAEKAGIQVGDIITALNDEPIRDIQRLIDAVHWYRPNDTMLLTLDRAGTTVKVYVVLV